VHSRIVSGRFGGLGSFWCVFLGRRVWRFGRSVRGFCGGLRVRVELADHLADLYFLADGFADLGDHARAGSRYFHGNFVGLDFDDGFIRLNRRAHLFEPAHDRTFDHRFAKRRDFQLQ
jgi:hypothetical protein